jgi:hypothetical protein
LVESNRNNRLDCSVPKRYMTEGCGKGIILLSYPYCSLLPPEEVCRPTQLTTGVRARDIPKAIRNHQTAEVGKGESAQGKKMIQ